MKTQYTLSILLLSLLLALPVYGQTEKSLAPGYSMSIEGTSNVRDWEAEIGTMEGSLQIRNTDGIELAALQPGDFSSLQLRIPVQDIDTDTRRLTRNLKDYLKGDEHPIITFELQQITSLEGSGNRVQIKAVGVVTAAGQSHTTQMNVTAERGDDGSLTFSGSQPLKMTEFGISPPTAMMGAIRAVDDITIHYNVRFN